MKKILFAIALALLFGKAGAQQIVQYEYWADQDFASRTAVTLTAPVADATISFQYSSVPLSDGLHTLNARFKDSNGKWSCVQTDYFYKNTVLASDSNTITDMEYWFDSDFTGRVAENLSVPLTNTTLNRSLTVTALSDGLHTLNVRFMDAMGNWSCVQTDFFLKVSHALADSNYMTVYEYWVDSSFSARVSGATSHLTGLIHIDSIDVAAYSEGYHTINYRFMDVTGKWSCVQSDTFKRCPSFYAPPVITGNTSVCAGQTITLTASHSDGSTLGYYWTGPNGFTQNDNTLTFTNATTAKSGTYYCTAFRGATACDSSIVATVIVTVNPLPVGVISGLSSVCNGDSTYLVVTGGGTYLWNSGSVNDSLLIKPTATTTYYVTITSDAGCVSTKSKSVTIKALPNVVVTPSSATVCEGVMQILTASGASTYVWSNGVTTAKDTLYPLVTSTYSVTGTGTNGCKKTVSSTITVNPLPGSAGLISGLTGVCPGQNSVIYTVPIIPDVTTYSWTLPSGATGSSNSNSITVNYGLSASSGVITVLGSNSCGEGSSSSLNITVNPLPATAGLISGSATVCPGQNAVTYSVSPVTDATSYSWTLPSGATGSSTSNSITLDFGLAAVSGNITVKGVNACGEGLMSTFPITVNALPTAAGTISGNADVCVNQSGVLYSVPVIDYATSYNWALPSGATGTSTTNNISVDFGSSSLNGIIMVEGVNGCGTGTPSSISVSVNTIPEAAGTIAGSASVCPGQNSVTYTVPIIPDATTYSWTLPSAATGSSTSNSITVNYGLSASSGVITVLGSNFCGEGSSSSLNITVNPLPATAGLISGPATVCPGQNAVNYSVSPVTDATSYSWTLPSGATGSSTSNSITLDFGLAAVSGNITVKGVNACGEGLMSTFPITVNALPTAAGTISGNADVCVNQSGVLYSVPAIDHATSYNWTLPSGATGTSTTNNISVDFGSSSLNGIITVEGVNGCGTGSVSSLAVTVSIPAENAGPISGTANVCQGQTSIEYNLPVIPNATAYFWTLPSGASGSSSTNSILINFGLSSVSGEITVQGTNGCGAGGSSGFNITVSPLPETAGLINGVTTVCRGQNLETYTVPVIPNANSYSWTLPSGAVGASITNSITVDFSAATSGNIIVNGQNECGDGFSSTIYVSVNEKPGKPSVSVNLDVLHSSAPTGNQWFDQSGLILNATGQDYTVTVNGDYYVIVTIDGCPSDPSDTVQIINVNTVQYDRIDSVNIYPNPASDMVIFEIKGNTEKVKISIVDALGQCVYSAQMIEILNLETSAFAPGVYTVKFEAVGSSKLCKIVIQ